MLVLACLVKITALLLLPAYIENILALHTYTLPLLSLYATIDFVFTTFLRANAGESKHI
jgi:hypothetical protein